MVYIYKKTIGGKDYYYLRASIRRENKIIAKDIAYLGSDIEEVKNKLKGLPSKYSKEIRTAYRNINKFLEANHYLQEIKSKKLKSNPYISRENLENLEACRLHWNKIFQKKDKLTKDEIMKYFIIEFAFNTTSIEGNTVTLKEAHKLLGENLTPKNRTLREIYDLQNTEKAFFDIFSDPKKKLSHEVVEDIHDKLLENIDIRKGYRMEDVRIFRMRFKSSPFQYIKTDMGLLFKWHDKNKKKLHPFVLAVVFHHKFEKIHPFMDGNGRTGRMLMNLILLKNNCPPAIIKKKNRDEYVTLLNRMDEIGLTKSDSRYEELVDFAAKELAGSYWNIFL